MLQRLLESDKRPGMKVDAVLPAGGRISGDFAVEAGARIKALISLGGRTLLERTLDALRDTGRLGKSVVIGPPEMASNPAARLADAVLPEGSSGPENIFRGLEWLRQANGGRHAEHVLMLTTDLPFLTSQAVIRFLDACPPELDICLPLVSREEFAERFPGLDSFFVRLHDGEWTIGCAFLVNPEALISNRRMIESVFAARKSQLAMARLLGPLFIWRFLTRRLTVAHIEQRALGLLGATGRGIPGCPPELALDIDRLEDYRYAARRCPA